SLMVLQTPMMLLGLLAGEGMSALGISRIMEKVLPFGPKKLCATPGGRGNLLVSPAATRLSKAPLSKKNGSSWMPERKVPPPRIGMFWPNGAVVPVLPVARTPLSAGSDVEDPVKVTLCTPLLSGAR